MNNSILSKRTIFGRRIAGVMMLCCGLMLASSTLGATTITVTLDNVLDTQYVDRTVDNGANWYTVDTGQFLFTVNSGDTSQLSGNFYAFCIEPREFISVGQTVTYDESTLANGTTNIGGMGQAKALLLEELFGRYDPNVNTPLSALQASAIQIAVWEIVRETSGTLDVYSGTTMFQNPQGATETQALALAQTYVQSLNGQGPLDTNVFALTNDGVQDMIVQGRRPNRRPTRCSASG